MKKKTIWQNLHSSTALRGKKVHVQLNTCSVPNVIEILLVCESLVYIIFRIKVPDSLPQELMGWIPKKVLKLLGSLLL